MRVSARSFTRLILGTIAGISMASLLLPQLSWAQVNQDNAIEALDSEQESGDPFSSRTDDANSSFGVFDLIHRAQMGNSRSLDEFSAEQNESLDAASSEFRKRQRELIQGQQQANPVNSVSTPQQAN